MEYREELERAYSNACDNYDKALLTLSGGALGISMAFIRNIVRDQPIHAPCLLLSAWIGWGASLLFTIASFYFSRLAIQFAISRTAEDKAHEGKPGGAFGVVTEAFAILGGAAFVVGVGFMIGFVSANMGGVP